MQELEEWIRSNIGHAREQRNEWPTQKDYYDGMLFAYGQMLNSIYTELLQKEKEVIIDAFLEGCNSAPDDGQPIFGKTWYNKTFNTKEK